MMTFPQYLIRKLTNSECCEVALCNGRSSSGLRVLARERVNIDDYWMTVTHVIATPSGSSGNNFGVYWLFDRITMTQLFSREDIRNRVTTIRYQGFSPQSCRVFHDAPHILACPNISNMQCYHVDLEGYALSGSNTFDSGRLCLGDTFTPYDFSALHLLCNYNANSDLGWRGSPLGVSYEGSSSTPKIIVNTWPRIGTSTRISLPRNLSGLLSR